MNKPLDRKSKVCLEALLYYMDKSKNDEYKKKGFIDLKEYAEKQVKKKNEELSDLKDKERRIQRELKEVIADIATLEDYDPNELTPQKIKEILKNVTATH
jgi:hypothetical protein